MTASLAAREGGLERADRSPVAYADAPNRLVAYALDAILLAILILVASIVVSLAFGPVVAFDSDGSTPLDVDRGLGLLDAALATAISLVYFVGTWRRLGGSPGQRLLGISVAGAEGPRLSLKRALVRWLPIGLPAGAVALLVPVLHGLGDLAVDLALLAWYVVLLATIVRSPTKQGWHDRLAASVVLKRARIVPDAD